jgi:Cys-rich protein (TIGR01571 family)
MSYQGSGGGYAPASPQGGYAPVPQAGYAAPAPYAPPAPPAAAPEDGPLLPPSGAPRAAFPTAPEYFRPGSNFFVHLCCATSAPWFMVGRVAHRLGLPNAWGLGAGALVLTALTFVPLAVATEDSAVDGGTRLVLALVAALFSLGLFLVTAVLRTSFREANGLPGTFLEDLQASVSWACCLPCYAPPAKSPNQCSHAFQLALMEGALVSADAAAGAGSEASGAAKEGAMLPEPHLRPPQVQGPPALGAGGGPGGGAPRWSSELLGCTCNQRCEGDVPLCFCAAAWGWWMQTRLMKRIGRAGEGDFWKVACGLFCLEGLPDCIDFVSASAGCASSVTLDVIGGLARLPVVLINVWLRRTVRDRFGIPEGFVCEDALVSCFCYPCAIAQQVSAGGVAGFLRRCCAAPGLFSTLHTPPSRTPPMQPCRTANSRCEARQYE